MAIAEGVEFVKSDTNKEKSLKDLLTKENNVRNLDINIPDLNKATDDNDNLNSINIDAEKDFDNFVIQNEATIKAFFEKKTYATEGKKWIEANFKIYLDSPQSKLNTYINQLKNQETTDIIKKTKFELEDLSTDIETYFLKNQINNSDPQPNTWDKPRRKSDVDVNNANTFVQNQGANVAVQYTADHYTDVKFDEDEDLDSQDDKKALKLLLKGKNEALDIVDTDYNPSWADKKALKLLTKVLLSIWDSKVGKQDINTPNIISALSKSIQEYNAGKRFDMNKGRRKKAKEYGDKDQYKLSALYQMARENVQWYPYLKRVMDLLVQEFTRENTNIDVNNKQKDFTDIYNEHNDLPTGKQLNLVTRKGKAIRAIENWTYHERQQIKKLLRLAEGVDVWFLMSMAQQPTGRQLDSYLLVGSEGRGILTKKEGKVLKLYNENSGNPQFVEVFQWLASGMTIQELANAGKFDIPPSGDEAQQEKWFVAKFADLNFDGRNDFWDKDMVKWLQFKNIYETVSVQMHYKGDAQNKPLVNILNFGKKLAEKIKYNQFSTKIDELLKTPTFANINACFNEAANIPLLKFLQKGVVESPLPVGDIIKYGTEAYQNVYNNSLELPAIWKDKVDAHLQSQLGNRINPDTDFEPVVKEWMIQAITSFVCTQQSGVGVGTNINIWALADANNPALDYLLDGLSISVGVWVSNSTDNIQTGVVGLSLWRNKSHQVGKSTAIYEGVSVWGARTEWFIPMRNLSTWLGIEQGINQKNLMKKLDVTSSKKITLGGNITIINCVLPSRWVNIWYSQDKMQGIETQYTNIKNQATDIGVSSLTALKDDFGDEQKSLLAIQKVLLDKFGKTSDAAVHKASFNMYRWLQAFNLTKADFDNPSKLYQVATMRWDFYALAWKNAAVTGLKWRNFDSASIGVQFFAEFFPVPTISLQWAKYKNLYFEDTPESQAKVNNAEATGEGNEYMNDAIGEKEIAFLNDTIEIPFRNSKSAINQIDKTSTNQVTDILFNEKDKTIKVPYDLREKNIINVNLDTCLQGHLQEEDIDGKKYLVMPAEIPVRLMTASKGTGVTFILNLGDIKSDNGISIKASKQVPSERLGDATNPIFEKTTKVEDINALITTLNVWDYINFPLVSAAKSTEANKQKQTVFTLLPQTKGKPKYAVYATNTTPLVLTGGTLTLTPEVGELTVNYIKSEDKYVFSYQDQPNDKLKITYRIDELTAKEKSDKNWTILKPITFNETTNKLFDFVGNTPLAQAKAIIDGDKNTLKDLEKNQPAQFSIFMESLWTIQDNNDINKTELNQAKDALIKILWPKNVLTLFISAHAKDYRTLAYVMDRMKQIFAIEKKYENRTIADLRKMRKDWYHQCKSPSGKGIPPDLVREELLPKPGTEKFDASKAKTVSNLIGYTAFYRDKKKPAYSMTAPGNTTVYDSFISKELAGDSLRDSKKRFLENLNAQRHEKALLLKAIQWHIREEFSDQIKIDDVISFLNTWEKIISIDNWKKKYKLTLQSSYHFYLLGECANESLGMKIWGIKIKEYKSWGGDIGGAESTWEVPQTYDNTNIWFWVNNAQTRNEAFRGKKSKMGVGGAFGVAKPKPAPEEDAIIDDWHSGLGIEGSGWHSIPGIEGSDWNSLPGIERFSRNITPGTERWNRSPKIKK